MKKQKEEYSPEPNTRPVTAKWPIAIRSERQSWSWWWPQKSESKNIDALHRSWKEGTAGKVPMVPQTRTRRRDS